MTDKTLLVGGAIGAGVIILLILSRKSQTQLAQQQLALSGQYAQTPAGQVGGILSSVGSFFNSGALSSLKDSFLNTGPNNEPGLISSPKPSLSNSPAMLTASDFPVFGPATPSDLNDPGLQTSLDYASLGLDA